MVLRLPDSWSNGNLEMLIFEERGKREYPEKPLGAKERTNNKLNPHMASTQGFQPGSHWWEASALATAPSLDESKRKESRGEAKGELKKHSRGRKNDRKDNATGAQ